MANADGEVEIEIRDLDQTVVGNPAHDLIRLASVIGYGGAGIGPAGGYDGCNDGTDDGRV